MKQVTLEEALLYALAPYGGFLGNITFVDESYKDFNHLKDGFNVAPEINNFCIVHGIDSIHDHEENLEEKLDNLLGEYSESYLIPYLYRGAIIWDLEHNILF